MAAGFMPETNIDSSLITYHLLAIGIDKYANSSKYPNLNNPQKDVDELADELQQRYRFKKVKKLKNEEATRQAILENIPTGPLPVSSV